MPNITLHSPDEDPLTPDELASLALLTEDDWTAESLGFPGWEETQLSDGNLMLSNPNSLGDFETDRATDSYLNNLDVAEFDPFLADSFRSELAQEDIDNFDNPNWY